MMCDVCGAVKYDMANTAPWVQQAGACVRSGGWYRSHIITKMHGQTLKNKRPFLRKIHPTEREKGRPLIWPVKSVDPHVGEDNMFYCGAECFLEKHRASSTG